MLQGRGGSRVSTAANVGRTCRRDCVVGAREQLVGLLEKHLARRGQSRQASRQLQAVDRVDDAE